MSLPFVIVGHVDHGKSTLIGRLLLDTGSIPDEVARTIAGEGFDGAVQLAHMTDHFSEERERGITIDTSQKVFESANRRYVIIDAPGHREFLKNMLSGASLAEAAILMIDAREGIMEQTYRHAYIVSIIGIRQVIVAVNKMDMVGWSKERFEELSEKVRGILANLKIPDVRCIPLCALKGDNVVNPSPRMPWYTGPTLLKALDAFTARTRIEVSLRFSVQGFYTFPPNGPYVVGRVESGVLRAGTEVVCNPGGMKAKIISIEKYGLAPLEKAGFGECVGIKIEGGARPQRGDILTGAVSGVRIADRVQGHIFWLSPITGHAGEKLLFRCATQEIPCTLENIANVFDPGNDLAVQAPNNGIAESHVADVSLRLERAAIFDSFEDVPSMGRFVLEKGDEVAAAGIIV